MTDSPNRDASPLRTIISWIIIVACAAMIFLQDVKSNRSRRDSSQTSGFQIEMASRYALGVKATLNSPETIPSLESSLREAAITPIDQLRLIPVIGQLEDDAAAEKAADEWLKDNSSNDLLPDVQALQSIYHGEKIDDDKLQALQTTYGFFGKLAAARAQGPDGQLQQEINQSTRRAFEASIATVVLLVGSLLAGLALLIFFSVRFFDKNLRPRLQRSDLPASAALLEGFTAYLLGMTTITLALPHFNLHGIGWEVFLIVPIALGVFWARLRIGGGRKLAEAVGWYRGHGILREAWAGFVGYIAGVPIVAAGMVITLLLIKHATTANSRPLTDHPIVYQLQHPGWPRVFLMFLACIFAPITEELMFRGMLLGHLRSRFGWLFSALVVSLIFASIHPQGWMAIPVLGSLAMVLAALREQRDSLVAPMTAHAINNTSLLIVFLWAMG